MSNFYDGTKLLSMLDINGNKPEIYMSTSNRSAGKTTYFNRLCVNRFKDKGEKFGLIYRFDYELDDTIDKFYKDIRTLFFNGHEMTAKRRAKGKFYELFFDDKSCGYSFALNNADQYKKYSHLFSDIKRLLFDEFQSETNHYCPDEVKKLISVHTSVARGQGEQVRYVPLYMVSNPVSIINPYYVEMGITSRLKSDTKFLKGDGFVLEQGYNVGASEAQKSSAFNRAFSKNEYVAYASEAVYLNDNKSFIEKPDGVPRYIATLKYKGNEYSIKEYADAGYMYCDDKADKTFPMRITTTTEDHNVNYVMLNRYDFFITNLRTLFEHGAFRFKNLLCKEAVLSALKY